VFFLGAALPMWLFFLAVACFCSQWVMFPGFSETLPFLEFLMTVLHVRVSGGEFFSRSRLCYGHLFSCGGLVASSPM